MDQAVIKEDKLMVKKGKQKLAQRNPFKQRTVRLISGQLLIYKKEGHSAPKTTILLSNCTITKDISKENTFSVKTEEENKVFCVATEEEYSVWMELLTAQNTANSNGNDAATVKTKKSRKGSLLSQAKKNVAGKVISSAMGKDLLKKIIDEETNEQVELLKILLVNEYGKEKADHIEISFIKLILKAHFAIENKLLTSDAFQPLLELSRKVCYLLSGAINMSDKQDALKGVLSRAAKVIVEIQTMFENSMESVLTEKNFVKIAETFASISDEIFLFNIYTRENNKETAAALIEHMFKFLVDTY